MENADMSTKTTTSKDGTVVAYDRTGEGPAVVLVHPAFGHRMGNPEFAGLAQPWPYGRPTRARLARLEGKFHALKPEVLAPPIADFLAAAAKSATS
jgi:hypothetical protein